MPPKATTRGPRVTSTNMIETAYARLLRAKDVSELPKEMDLAVTEGSLPAIRLVWDVIREKLLAGSNASD